MRLPPIFALLTPLLVIPAAQGGTPAPVRVELQTVDGNIVLELNPAKAPVTVKNFLRYVREGHYDNTIFHRVIAGFMIQGGGFTPDYKEKPTHEPIENESGNGLSNLRGTIAMARTSDPDSATAQFYINLVDNTRLDTYGGGYAVFGKVVDGMDVVDRIAEIMTGPGGPFRTDVPQRPAIVLKARVLDDKPEKE